MLFIHLRKSLSQLFCVADDFICAVAVLRLSRASIAARCARIFSAIAESLLVLSVRLFNWVLNVELLFSITSAACKRDPANINVVHVIPNNIKSFKLTRCFIFYFTLVHAVL